MILQNNNKNIRESTAELCDCVCVCYKNETSIKLVVCRNEKPEHIMLRIPVDFLFGHCRFPLRENLYRLPLRENLCRLAMREYFRRLAVLRRNQF